MAEHRTLQLYLDYLAIMDDLTFVADYDYEAKNETELSFNSGDTIRITSSQDGWFYGQHNKSGKSGWVPPSYGHTRHDSPYNKISPAMKEEKRTLLFKNIISAEHEFIGMLQNFIQDVITPINLRDTPFKRSFLNDSSVAVSFSLLQDLYKACYNFDSIMKTAKSEIEIANAYIQFAPSLQIYAQYAPENAKLLNTIKGNSKQLSEIIPDRIDIVPILLQPMEHCSMYKALFQEYVWLSNPASPDYSALQTALEMIISQTLSVEEKIKEEEESWKLLNLQQQCK